MAIRPPRDDLYRDLGVSSDATGEELNAAFRALAKALHPDALPGDAAATEEFKRVSRAYSVLRDPVQRAQYDAGTLPVEPALAPRRAAPTVPMPPPVPPPPRPPAGFRLTRRGARWALGGGIVLVVLGVLAAVWVAQLQRADADLLADGVATEAVVVRAGGERRFEFTTRSGEIVQAVESTKSGTNQPDVGTVVEIRYDRDDPTRIVLDASHTARNVTLWIVAVKFFVGGGVITVLAWRRLRRA